MNKKENYSPERAENYFKSTENSYGGSSQRLSNHGMRGDFVAREETEFIPTPLNHSGKGPKNFKRSDERILEDSIRALTENAEVDASDIEVKVENSIVVLQGSVSSRDEKRMAERAVEHLFGVKDVRNELNIRDF